MKTDESNAGGLSLERIKELMREAAAVGCEIKFYKDGRIASISGVKVGEKPKAKTNAERQREYRERQKNVTESQTPEPETVTEVTNVTEIEQVVTAPSSPSPSLSPSPCPLSPPFPTPLSSPLPLIPSPQSQPHPHQPRVFESLDLPLDIEAQPPAEKPKQETDETVLALFSIFNRRPRTLMSDKERKAFKLARIQPEDLEVVLDFYGDPHPEWDGKDFRKRDLATLLNNWTSEVDRATSWQAFEKGKHIKKPIFSKTI